MIETLKNRRPERSGRQFNHNDEKYKPNEINKCVSHSKNGFMVSKNSSFDYKCQSKTNQLNFELNIDSKKLHKRTIKQPTKFFPKNVNLIPKPRHFALNNKRLDKNNRGYWMNDKALTNKYNRKENLTSMLRYKADIINKPHLNSPVYLTYDQTTNNNSWEPQLRFAENFRRKEKIHKRSKNNHNSGGSQTPRRRPSAIRNKELSKKINSQDERTKTLMESEKKDRSNYNVSDRLTDSMKADFEFLSSYRNEIDSEKSTKSIRRNSNVKDELSNLKVLNTIKAQKSSEHYISPRNPLTQNSERQSSHNLTKTRKDYEFHQTPHVKEPNVNSCWRSKQHNSQQTHIPILNCFGCCLHKQTLTKCMNPHKTSNNTLVQDDNGYYSSKQQSPHSTTSENRNNKLSDKVIFPSGKTETMMKSNNIDNFEYNNSYKTTNKPAKTSEFPNSYHNTSAPNSERQSSRMPKETTKNEKSYLRISPNANKIPVLDDSAHYSPEQPNSSRGRSFKQHNSQQTHIPILNCFGCCRHKQTLTTCKNPPNTPNKLSVPDDNGYYSSKPQLLHSVTTSAIGNKELLKKTTFLSERNETLIISDLDRILVSRNSSIQLIPSNENRSTAQRTIQHSHYTPNFNDGFSNLKVSNMPPKTSSKFISAPNSTEKTNNDEFDLSRISSLAKTLVPVDNAHYSEKHTPEQIHIPILNCFYCCPTNKTISQSKYKTKH